MALIRWLTELDRNDVSIAGGKGARLGDLARAGFPVPSGFVLLTSAYEAFVESNGLRAEIERLSEQVQPDQLSSAAKASEAIRALFDSAAIPEETAREILASYGQMGQCAVAVRSSSASEDMVEASSAGQHESFLNVAGPDGVLAAVKRCWSSLWTGRAMIYRIHQKTEPDANSMAVVVQRLIPASASGILFTANPVSGDQSEIVINAAWGLGEAIVGGQVGPDIVVVEKATGRVKSLKIGDKASMAVPTDNGTAHIPVEDQTRKQQVLTHDEIVELARLGRKIEEHFDGPQDIEWAIAESRIFILQSRPVTRYQHRERAQLSEMKHAVPGDDSWGREDERPAQPFDLWTRTNLGENLPYPISPLTATGFIALFDQKPPQKQAGSGDPQVARRFFGRLYVNEGAIMHTLSEDYGLPSGIIDTIWGSRRRGKHQSRGRFRPWRLLRHVPSLLRQGMSQARKREPKQKPEEFFAQIDGWVEDFMRRDLSQLDDEALWGEGLPVWGKRGGRVFGKNIAIATSAAFTFAVLERLVNWWGGGKAVTHDLVTGLAGVYSAEVGPVLWQMAQTLISAGLACSVIENSPAEALTRLKDESVAQPFLEQLESFLRRHGHRCPNEVELLNPRWAEAPEQVIAMLAGYLKAGDNMSPVEAEASQRRRREEATATVKGQLGRLRRAIFRFALARTQQAVRLRDNSRYYVAKFYFPMRKLYAHMGKRWADRGWLSRPDDIFFLTVSEIERIVEAGNLQVLQKDINHVVADRRLAYDYWYHVTPPEVIGPDGTPLIEATSDSAFLQGIPASGGRARGVARLIHNPDEAIQLRPGDILVTQATDPGWTPVFPLVSGLVLELGGQLSHGAIVAREYGVPAVVNVPGALRHIQDGQSIIVDGTEGRVYL